MLSIITLSLLLLYFHYGLSIDSYRQTAFKNAMKFGHVNDISLDLCKTVSYLGYRTSFESSNMYPLDCRNTLIVELKKLTSNSIKTINSLSNDDLIGYSYGTNGLWYYNITTSEQLSKMTLDDHRNMIITELTKYYPFQMKDINLLQSFNTLQLTNHYLSYHSYQSNEEKKNINDLQLILGDLTNINSSHIKFNVHDSNGNSMDAIHIIQSNESKNLYYAVYHTMDSTETYNIAVKI